MNYLSINDVRKFKEGASVWVLNVTKSSPLMRKLVDADTGEYRQERADVFITIPPSLAGGDKDFIIVPQSFLPTDLTEFVSLHDLLLSRPFVKAVREGLLAIISDEDAQDLFNQEGAKEELARLAEAKNKIRDIANSITSSVQGEVINTSERETKKKVPEEVISLEAAKTVEDSLDPTFVGSVQKWTTMSDILVLNEIRSIKLFKRKELKYILANLKNHPKTSAYIKKALGA